MALRMQNPYYVRPASAPEKLAATHQTAVDNWLKTQTGKETVTLGEIRTALPAIAADLSRTVINIIAANLGVAILNPDDAQG